MIDFQVESGKLSCQAEGLIFADQAYRYGLSGSVRGGITFANDELIERDCRHDGPDVTVKGRFAQAGIELQQVFHAEQAYLDEVVTLRNVSEQSVELESLEIGFVASLENRPGWRLCAIPFRVQLDGTVHDYPVEVLIGGDFGNATYTDPNRLEPDVIDEGYLRSEAWAWFNGESGLAIMKYNNAAIELSVAAPKTDDGGSTLRFGGVGFSLYGEPSTGRHLLPGEQITFGVTRYMFFEGGLNQAFSCYRDWIDSKGHGFCDDYNPPVNWNELYDLGWHHNDMTELKKLYTRENLLREAEKAVACGCELLYLDPGWEVIEGTTQWDESRLGPVTELVETLKKDYGLKLGYRTILRCFEEYWPEEYLVKHADRTKGPLLVKDSETGQVGHFREVCLCNDAFFQEKLRRILEISRQGVEFMMLDEMDWRGGCCDAGHGHPVPCSPFDHTMAVYSLARQVRQACPGLTVEVHDPVWPWFTSIYVPTYFQQGFGDKGAYEENWGFEYMWDCINDLRSGKALALYYYNLGCSIPLYLHITMAADNDNCLFFWWAASTVRHLGVGGKNSHKSIEPKGGLPEYDKEKRFAAYQEQMKVYKRLKPLFVRGTFHGLAENIHLHTLRDACGGVINVFNITDRPQEYQFSMPTELLGEDCPRLVQGAQMHWTDEQVEFELTVPAMSPGIVTIGDWV